MTGDQALWKTVSKHTVAGFDYQMQAGVHMVWINCHELDRLLAHTTDALTHGCLLGVEIRQLVAPDQGLIKGCPAVR